MMYTPTALLHCVYITQGSDGVPRQNDTIHHGTAPLRSHLAVGQSVGGKAIVLAKLLFIAAEILCWLIPV